ncbi:hypothetical protein Runsl_1790 [Runella slithyformis DSM 19594]|uniref:Uncharacterized protein n=1 Tax=Runella slithyformis (strain ATCC 29530 / DSM 19594 / LMG 11500 / NCIMB 11436 / LSU 4) TaxID=761193 RepID=A0A7U3ZJ76_RUNSL|nr:hypothetical protein Runsl_1790 [Runella slithyformis DSM 19594]
MIQLVKSPFSLFILLLSGYFQYAGSTLYESNDSSSVRNSHYSIPEKSHRSVFFPVLYNKKGDNILSHSTDIEEKENQLNSFKKSIVFSAILKSAFYSHLSGYLFRYTLLPLFFLKLCFYHPFAKSLYLKFEVMRI